LGAAERGPTSRFDIVGAAGSSGEAPHHEVPLRFLAGHGAKVLLFTQRGCSWPAGLWPSGALRVVELGVPRSRVAKLAWHVHLFFGLRRGLGGRAAVLAVQGSAVCPTALVAEGVRLRKRPVVYHTQDFLEPGRYPVRGRVERAVAARARVVVVNEVNRGRALQSLYQLPTPPVVAPTALPREWPFPEPNADLRARLTRGTASQDSKVIFHIGGFSSVRCTEPLIRALGHLESRYLLVLTSSPEGSASAARIAEVAEGAGVASRLCLLPHLTFTELLAAVAASDVGCLLYANDGIGNFYQGPGRLTEYVGCGVPVVASDFPGLRCVLERHGLGATADPQEPESIARVIREVCEGGRDRQERRERLRRSFREDLCFEAGADRFLDVWEALLHESGWSWRRPAQ
jgi:glycosyltransferase involved in cell wall biosynthesis